MGVVAKSLSFATFGWCGVRLWNFDVGKHKPEAGAHDRPQAVGLAGPEGGRQRSRGRTNQPKPAQMHTTDPVTAAADAVVAELQTSSASAPRVAITVGLGEETAAVVGDLDGTENSTWRPSQSFTQATRSAAASNSAAAEADHVTFYFFANALT